MRQVIAWINYLPSDSATGRALHGDEAIEWGLTEHLLAGTIDLLAWANYQRAGGQGSKPRPIKRPGVTDNDRRHGGATGLSTDEAKRILTGYRTGAYEGAESTREDVTTDGD